MSKNIFEQSESRLEQERNVFLQKYGIAVRTDLQRADEIEYATDTQILNKPKENYFAMTDFEEPIENIAERALKEIPFNSLALSSPITANAYAAYVLAKNPIVRGLVASNIQLGREAFSYMTKEAATLGVAAGMDIDTRMKEHAKIDEEKAKWPASLRLHDKVMGDVKRAGEFLTPFQPIDIERVKERVAAWHSEQKKVDEFNEKVKIVVDNFLERSGLAKNEKDGFWYDFGAVGGSVLSSISLLAMFRIPAIGAMLFAAAEGQGTYEEAIKAGITPEKAYGLGKINATWIAATEMLGDKFLSKILYGKGVLGKYSKKILESVKKGKMPAAQDVAAFAVGAAKSGGIESIQETSQNIGSDIIGNVGGISEKSASDIIKGGFYSGALAFPFGFFGGGVASLSNFRQYADNVSKTLQDHGMEKETADKIGREMALTVTSSEFVDDAIKAVSSEINSPLTAEDRDPQKFARVLTEAQTREIEQESWNVEERVREQGIAAGVAPEVAEASGKVAQTLVNNIYTLAKITPSEQKNFKIGVINGSAQQEAKQETTQAQPEVISADNVQQMPLRTVTYTNSAPLQNGTERNTGVTVTRTYDSVAGNVTTFSYKMEMKSRKGFYAEKDNSAREKNQLPQFLISNTKEEQEFLEKFDDVRIKSIKIVENPNHGYGQGSNYAIIEFHGTGGSKKEGTFFSMETRVIGQPTQALYDRLNNDINNQDSAQPFNQPSVQQRDLFATHNMNLAGAKQAVKMGGLAMPSMAIRKTDSERVAEFGDVSFVGNENLVKPSRSTEVYDRDAWTPSIYNSLRYRLSKNAKQKIEDILKKTGEEKQRSMYVYNIEEYFSDATRNEMALDLFLKEKGLPEEERQKKWNSPEYISWYNETFFDDATPYLFTENDDNTDMVERKFTLNNVMKVLRKQERAAGGYIGDHLFSVQELIKFFPQKFRNLKELRAKKQNLQTTEQIFEKIEELDKDFDSLIAELRTSGEEKEYGADRHAVGIAIANTGDLETQKHWLHNAGLPSDNEAISKINKFAERIKNEIPVSYFEAKPRKVVDFGQFSGVIMPNTKDYDGLANDLETKYNLPVFRIEKGNAQQYKEALSEIQKQVPTTFFQSGFHGGPNRFDTFSLEYIGTGEGAQMHGYGVYVAEQKGVGIHYRTTHGGQIFYKGQPINELLHNLEKNKQYDRAALVEDFALKMDHEALDKDYYSAEDLKWFEEEILPDIKQEGFLAEVEIPENDVLLDEQKTFENQPEQVQKAIKALGISFYSQDPDIDNYTARTYIERIYDGMDKEDALKEIRKRIEDSEHLIEQNEGILKEAREMGLGISAYDLGYNKEAERHNIELLKEAIEIVDKLEKSNSWYKGKTGGEIYRLLTGFNGGSPKRASKQLLSIGVEGITYEGETDGRCFVIFDDKAVKIKKTFYQFAGPSAETADPLALNTAKQMEADGIDMEGIRQQTGWFKGVDGKWRFEISDKDAKLKMDIKPFNSEDLYDLVTNFRKLMANDKDGGFLYPPDGKEAKGFREKYNSILAAHGIKRTIHSLGEVLSHDKLFEAYPFLKDISVRFEVDLGAAASYDNMVIRVDVAQNEDPEKIRTALLHEIQHAIQDHEGFARGGNPNEYEVHSSQIDRLEEERLDISKKIKEMEENGGEARYGSELTNAYNRAVKIAREISYLRDSDKMESFRRYKSLAGEIEARNTEKRANLSEEERKSLAPEKTQDVSNARAIVVFDDGTSYKYQEPNKRGSVTIDGDAYEAIIRVFENSDPSTIIHELAHIYLTMINNAAKVSMDPEFQQLVSDINAWLGEPAGENGAYSTEQQETFARAFEGYMSEGKSPNKEMEGIFEKFAKWLAEVYESVKDYLQITPEVRSIFDRLLTTEEPVKKSKYVGNSARARELLEAIKTGFKNEDSLELGEMKALLKTTSTRRPRKPKDNLLKDLKKHGAEYANAGQIDKEAYANSGVKDKKGGIDDKPDLWLQKMGYMDFEESTDETVAAAWDMIQDALDGKEVYRLEDQDRAAQIEAYDENLKLLQEIFPDMMESANTKRLISELESQGYRIVEKKDIKNLEKALDILTETVLTETENKKDEKQLYKAANRVRREVISEIEKRQLEGKQGMLMLLENAKSAEEIRAAVEGVLEQVEKAYESTEEAKQEKEMLAVPNTDYGKLKIQILKEINQINKDTSSKLQEAEKRLSDLVRNGNKSDPEVQAEIRDAKQIIEQLRGAPYERAIRAALAGIRHLPAADKGKFMRSFMGAKYKNFLPSELDSLLARAKEIEENNYKKHMIEKIQDLLRMNLFDRKGSLKKALFDPETMNALSEMKRAMNLSPEQAAEELNARMQMFVEKPASQADRIVNEILSIVANDIKDISTTLCKQTYDDVYELRKAGKSRMNLEKMIKDFRTETDKKNVLSAIKKNKKAGVVKKMYASWLANWESILDLCTNKETKEEYSMLNLEADSFTHQWQRRTEIMNGVRDIYRLGRNKDVYGKMNELLEEKHVFMNYFHVDRNPDPAAIKKTGEAFEEELNKMQIITLYIWSKNDILADRLAHQYGWEQLKQMFFEILDANDRKLGDFLQQEAEKSYNEINAVFVKERGYDLPKVQAYFPSITERVESELDFLQAAAGSSQNPYFTKARASSAKIEMKPENPFGILFRHIERASDYHYKAEKMNRIRRVFKSTVIKHPFIKQFGEDVYNRMLEMIDQFSVTKPRINYDMDKLGDWLTNNYVKGAIALKPTVGLKQLVSSVNYAENMPSHLWVKGFIEAWMHPKETVKFMKEGDPYLKARFESGSMNEALSRAIADAKAIGAGRKFVTLTDLLTLNTRLGDIGAICFGGKAYVDYLINVKGMSKEDAFAEFRKATLRSQQSNTRSSLSTLQAKDMNFLMRALFAFKNTPAQYARKIADAIWEYQRGEISAAQLGKVVAIYALINSWLYNMLTTLGLLAYFNDDDESEEIIAAELFFGPFVQMAGCLPILDVAVSAVAEVIQAKCFDRKPRLKEPEIPTVAELFDLGKKALKEDIEGKDVMEMLASAGHLFGGLPAQYMKGFAIGTKDLVTGENPMRGFLMMLGYTERRARIATGTRED